jgi:hypothetical protein
VRFLNSLMVIRIRKKCLIDGSSPVLYQFTQMAIKVTVVSDRLCGLVVRVSDYRSRFPALPDFLRISESGTWSIQPREYD